MARGEKERDSWSLLEEERQCLRVNRNYYFLRHGSSISLILWSSPHCSVRLVPECPLQDTETGIWNPSLALPVPYAMRNKARMGEGASAVKQTLQTVQICFWHLQDSQALSWKYVLAEVPLTNMFLYVYNPRKYLTCLSTLRKDVLASQPSLHSVGTAGLHQG